VSHETNGTDGASLGIQRTAADDYIWIKCRGCRGEIGVPSDWNDPGAECPSCGLIIQVHGRMLYRPPASGQVTNAPIAQPPNTNVGSIPIQSRPSLGLGQTSDGALLWGILSVVLGWTVIVPLIGFCYYWNVTEAAQSESVPVPRKAFVGVILSLLFGAAQTIAMIAHLSQPSSWR
jgi:hypothetical protein